MFEYHKKQCSRCDGIGIVRFFLLFRRTCPECYGMGTVYIPQFKFRSPLKKSKSISSPAGKFKPMYVSELTPKTRTILKNNPQLLSTLSRKNQTTLLRKYSTDLPYGKKVIKGGGQQQEWFKNVVQQQQQQHQQQFQNFVNQAIQQHQNFSNWSQQQHQNWTNQQFNNFASQFQNFGR